MHANGKCCSSLSHLNLIIKKNLQFINKVNKAHSIFLILLTIQATFAVQEGRAIIRLFIKSCMLPMAGCLEDFLFTTDFIKSLNH